MSVHINDKVNIVEATVVFSQNSQPYILSESIFNGIIFYANAGNVGILDMLRTRYTTSLQLSYCQGGHFLLTVLNVVPGILYLLSIG